MKAIKNIIKVTFSNVINYGTSFITGFILPALLSVSDYGYYREYMLFLSFAFIFNFGFNDGIYIKYGGKNNKKLNNNDVHEEHNFVLFFQFIIMVVMVIFSLLLDDLILLLFSISTFFVLSNSYHQNFLQAIGQFDIFSKGNILKSAVYFLLLLFSVIVLKIDRYEYYIVINIISLIFMFLYFELKRKNILRLSMKFNLKDKYSIFKIGIFILIGNMSLAFVGNIGSLVVNYWFSIEDFAQFSFQNSILNITLLLVNAVGLVFYNIISRRNSETVLKIIKEISLLVGVFSGAIFFIFAFIINVTLPEYIRAIPLLSIVFISIPYIMVSKILIANLYKTKRNEKKYFYDSILFALFSFLIVNSVYFLARDLIYIAFATTFCYIFWYIYTTQIEFKYLKSNRKEIFLLVTHFLSLFITSNFLTLGQGIIAYSIYLVIIIYIFKDRIRNNYFILIGK